jgi:hypothetical protein
VAVLLAVASASKFMMNYIVRTFEQLRFGTPVNGGAYCVTASCTIYANKVAASFSVLILCYVNSMSLERHTALPRCPGEWAIANSWNPLYVENACIKKLFCKMHRRSINFFGRVLLRSVNFQTVFLGPLTFGRVSLRSINP